MTDAYKEIQGWFDYEDFYKFVVDALPETARVAELGVWKGKSTRYLAELIQASGKAIELHAVDTFAGSPNEIETTHAEAKDGCIMCDFLTNVGEPFADFVQIHKSDTAEAVATFGKKKFDFVFIDADHAYESVKKDIAAWLPKVKKGGIIAGHDYEPAWSGVMQAVNEAFGDRVKVYKNSTVWYVTVD